MKTYRMQVGFNSCNCYLVKSDNNKGLLIDPGGDGERILKLIRDENIIVENIVLTHGHFDHIGAVDFLRKKLDSIVNIHKLDNPALSDPEKNLSIISMDELIIKSADSLLENNDLLFDFTIIHTPGHSPGGISLYNAENKILFSGDTLFNKGYGRTDFPGADQKTLYDSIEKLMSLAEDTIVYPGHGLKTTVKDFKYFFRNLTSLN